MQTGVFGGCTRVPGWNHDTHYRSRILAACPPRCCRALEVGCGAGDLSVDLSRMADDVIGIDRDPAMLALARERHPGLDWRCVDFLRAELPPCDFIVFVASIHHMDMRAAMERSLSLLRPGGVICVLGLARSTRFRDWSMDVVGFVTSRALRLVRQPASKSGARIVAPTLSYARVQALAGELPNARYERLTLFRYLLTVRA